MAVTLVSAGIATQNASVSEGTLTGAQAGDLVIVWVATKESENWNVSFINFNNAGATRLTRMSPDADNNDMTTWYGVLPASSTQYTVVYTGSNLGFHHAWHAVLRNAHPTPFIAGTDFRSSTLGTAGDTITAPAAQSIGDGGYYLVGVHGFAFSATITPLTTTLTQRAEQVSLADNFVYGVYGGPLQGTQAASGVSFSSTPAQAGLSGVAIHAVSDPSARVRSNASLTVGNLLQATESPQFELSAREAFFKDVDLAEGILYPFSEALDPRTWAHVWYPLATPPEPGLSEYAASTKLGRMTRAYPEPFVARAVDLVGTETMTAQQVLEQLFARWASEFDWFTYKTVPDLRYRVASADAPGDYTAGVGELTLPAIVMRQEESDRRTMRQILDRVLSLFPGTALVQDSEGDIALRPTYGPDAPTTPDVTLTTDDIASISDGVPDTQRIYNLARVTSDGGDFEPDTALTTSLYGLIADGPEAEEALGPDGENVLPTTREEVDVKAWHPFDVLAAGDDIEVTYTIRLYALYYGSDPTMTNPPSDVTLEATETAAITLTLGAGETVVTVSDTVGEFLGGGGIDPSADVTFEATREAGIKIGYTTATSYGSVRHFSGTSWFRFAWVVEVDTAGLGYVEATETVIGKFGYDLTTDEILATDGTSNALAVSQTTYGERELQLSSDLFPLTLEQALRIAEGAVLHYINPRTIYQVEQSWWRAFPVKPDHIGRIAELPSTEQGFVQARDYLDSYEDPEAPQLASTFEIVLTEAAFTTAGLLAFDDGTLMAFDDGTLMEVE